VREALAAGELHWAAGDERVRNDTVLSFTAGTAGTAGIAGMTGRGATPPPLEGVAPLVARWNDELLPDLITLRGQRQEEVVRRLRERLPELKRAGFESFRFKDLVDPLKADVRTRWADLLDQSQGEAAPQITEGGERERARLAPPDLRVEDRQLFRWLVDCVLASMRRLDVGEKTRAYLNTLWQFARAQASEGEVRDLPDSRLRRALQAVADEERPSHRRIAELLRIPRERLPGLYEMLGDLLEQCRAANSGRAAVEAVKGPGAFRDGRAGSNAH
jgi:hypothetical protein